MSETVRFINVNEAAKLLSSTPKTLYSWVHYKQIPEKVYLKIGRKLIFLENELLQWVLDGAELKKRTNANTNENTNTNIKIENNNNLGKRRAANNRAYGGNHNPSAKLNLSRKHHKGRLCAVPLGV